MSKGWEQGVLVTHTSAGHLEKYLVLMPLQTDFFPVQKTGAVALLNLLKDLLSIYTFILILCSCYLY